MTTTQILQNLYVEVGVPLDQLPYTPEMDHIVEQYNIRADLHWSHEGVWRKLIKMRKQERTLPRLTEERSRAA